MSVMVAIKKKKADSRRSLRCNTGCNTVAHPPVQEKPRPVT